MIYFFNDAEEMDADAVADDTEGETPEDDATEDESAD